MSAERPITARVQVPADEAPEVPGPGGLVAGRELLGETAQDHPDGEQGPKGPGLAEMVQLGAVALPGLGQRQQHMGTEGALAAAGLAEQGQLPVGGQGLEAGDRPRLARFAGRVTGAGTIVPQPLGQGCVRGNRQGGVQWHIDIGKLQGLPPGLLGGDVDLAELQTREVRNQGVQIEGDDRLRLLRVLAALDDLGDVLDQVTADEMAAWRTSTPAPSMTAPPWVAMVVPVLIGAVLSPSHLYAALAEGDAAALRRRAGAGSPSPAAAVASLACNSAICRCRASISV